MIKTLNKQQLLDYSKQFDSETLAYCIDDCIATWDRKNLWFYNPPRALIDEGQDQLLSVIFYSTELWLNARVAYVQRLFTPVKHRNHGHFSKLITNLYEELFDKHYKFIKMFTVKTAGVYHTLNFTTLFDTRDQKYSFCLQPIVYQNMKINNQLVASNGPYGFYSKSIMQYIETQIKEYA